MVFWKVIGYADPAKLMVARIYYIEQMITYHTWITISIM